ncbi:hypothetical protein ACFSTI_24805 [Rhizorhabdus histidinilytica]
MPHPGDRPGGAGAGLGAGTRPRPRRRQGRRPVYFGKDAGWVETSIYRRGQLPIGRTFAGPAIIEEMSSTLIVQPGQTVTVDPVGNLIVSIFE